MNDMRGEQACADCGKQAPAEELVEVDDEHHLCEACHERVLADGLVEDRAPTGDDEITQPTGNPDEAAHRGSRAA